MGDEQWRRRKRWLSALAVGFRPSKRVSRSGPALQAAHLRATLQVPQAQRAVSPAAQRARGVRRQRDRQDPALVALQAAHLRAAYQVPQAQRAVIPAAQRARGVRRQRDRSDPAPALVALQAVDC